MVQYKQHNGKYYLSYASLASPVIGGDKQKASRLAHERARVEGSNSLDYTGLEYDGRILDPDKNNYFRYDELYIAHIYNKKDRPKKDKLMERKKYVHRYNVHYRSTFWNNYNVLQLNPNLKRVKSHLKEAEIIN